MEQMKLENRNKSFILAGNVSYIHEIFHTNRKNTGDKQGV